MTERLDRTPILPTWATGRTARCGGALLLTVAMASCAGQEQGYTGGNHSVAAGTDVYDGSGSLGSCGNTTAAKTAKPIGEDVKVDGIGGAQDGQVMRYEFAEDVLPLNGGNTCDGSVWVYAMQAPAA